LPRKVVILGGGVAGMSAAHELIERGFEVSVYEFKLIPGGKARSIPATGSGTEGRKDLPGEHGFRLFPRFYKHVIDTMKRIPYGQNHQGVYDNLVEVERLDLATYNHIPVPLVVNMKFSFKNLRDILIDLFDNGLGLSKKDVEQYVSKLWQVMTSCEERKLSEYQDLDWWKFIEAQQQSPAFQRVFAGITRTLVAAKAKEANARTVGNVGAQLSLDMIRPGTSFVRLLNGPTNDKWIDPWLSYLTQMGVDYRCNAKVERLNYSDGIIQSVEITENVRTYKVTADYYIAAFPVEVMATFISDEWVQSAPSFDRIRKLAKDNVEWMNGIQFYLKWDIPITPGHVVYLDAPWALTSVAQKQFWPGVNLADYGDGQVKGILSVDISEWNKAGILYSKTAMECTAQEIKDEVWAQLKKSLNVGGQTLIEDQDLHSWFLDTDIHFTNPHHMINLEPLLVNNVGTWQLRPEAKTEIPNLFLASDYVRTNTDLATMEGANEAARRAVNAVLDDCGSTADRCKLWEMYRYDMGGLDLLSPWREHDLRRWNKGLPWDGRLI
jgi:15-cis-phytoene desaturase